MLSGLICADCGEAVMESRVRWLKDQILCIPCFEAAEGKKS
ncbi:MAG: TraR/DksA C4-type zinc finger protein [Thermodesulfobacteriota bacterium]